MTGQRRPVILVVVVVLAGFLGAVWHTRSTTATTEVGGRRILHDVDSKQRPPGTVQISAVKRQLAGVTVATVERAAHSHPVRVLGRVAADESRLFAINATVDGWITDARPNTTGSFVRKDEVLATFYSPEFLSAVQALVFALDSQDRVRHSAPVAQTEQLTQFRVNLQQFKDSLRNLGMGQRQIEDVIRTRAFGEQVHLTSPADGFVLARNVSHGLRFDKGKELYRIAALDRVWIVADVFEHEIRHLKPGTTARVTHPQLGRQLTARVSHVLPQFDGATRTLKVRLEADNPGFVLRPDMFVDVDLAVTTPPAIVVPRDAVLDSGRGTTVYVDGGDGLFEPRAVRTGPTFGDRVEIVDGLRPGETIVVSGNFLVDSESRMRSPAAGAHHVGSQEAAPDASAHAGHHPVAMPDHHHHR